MTDGAASVSRLSTVAAATGSFRLVTKIGSAVEAGLGERPDQRIDRRQDCRPAPAPGRRPAPPPAGRAASACGSVEVALIVARPVAAGAQQRPRFLPVVRRGRSASRRSAGTAAALSMPPWTRYCQSRCAGVRRQGREAGQVGVRLIVAGQERDRQCPTRAQPRRSARRRRASSRGRRAVARRSAAPRRRSSRRRDRPTAGAPAAAGWPAAG